MVLLLHLLLPGKLQTMWIQTDIGRRLRLPNQSGSDLMTLLLLVLVLVLVLQLVQFSTLLEIGPRPLSSLFGTDGSSQTVAPCCAFKVSFSWAIYNHRMVLLRSRHASVTALLVLLEAPPQSNQRPRVPSTAQGMANDAARDGRTPFYITRKTLSTKTTVSTDATAKD